VWEDPQAMTFLKYVASAPFVAVFAAVYTVCLVVALTGAALLRLVTTGSVRPVTR
jgi:hypothetical protein